jgi:hypothetical protein
MTWEELFPIAVFTGIPFIIAFVLLVIAFDKRRRDRS